MIYDEPIIKTTSPFYHMSRQAGSGVDAHHKLTSANGEKPGSQCIPRRCATKHTQEDNRVGSGERFAQVVRAKLLHLDAVYVAPSGIHLKDYRCKYVRVDEMSQDTSQRVREKRFSGVTNEVLMRSEMTQTQAPEIRS